jgi:S-formylglutathione hydrolase FrmB
MERVSENRRRIAVGVRPAAVLAVAAAIVTAGSAGAQQRGRVTVDHFRSDALGVPKDYLVYLPPSYQADRQRRFPVAYYLHGAFGSEDDWVQRGGIDVVLDSLVAAGMPEMIVVMPDGDDSYYVEWASDYDRMACPRRTDLREAATRYCVRRPRYDDYIARDLVQVIDLTYRTVADAQHRGIAGLSMGGFGALSLATEYPDVWAAAASHSGPLEMLALAVDPATRTATYAASADTLRPLRPNLWPLYMAVFGPDTAAWWARDPAGRIRRLKPEDVAHLPALYADIGTEDARLTGNRAFRAELARLGVPLDYHEYPGAHDWTYWRAHVAQSLVWLSQHFGR